MNIFEWVIYELKHMKDKLWFMIYLQSLYVNYNGKNIISNVVWVQIIETAELSMSSGLLDVEVQIFFIKLFVGLLFKLFFSFYQYNFLYSLGISDFLIGIYAVLIAHADMSTWVHICTSICRCVCGSSMLSLVNAPILTKPRSALSTLSGSPNDCL